MSNLEKLRTIEQLNNPNPNLEQYFTPPGIALNFLEKIDLKDKVIADLGCGNGILGLTALLLGARKVYFFDIDKNALVFAEKNYNQLKLNSDLGEALFINKDISLVKKSEFSDVDVSTLNPPFGTTEDNKKLDVVFLKKAIKLSNKIVSMHKTVSKSFIEQVFKDNNFTIIYDKGFLFPIPKTYAHHKQEVMDVEVTVFIAKKQ